MTFIESDSPAIQVFAEERTRQVVEKGYTSSHDDNHDTDELIAAGKAYIDFALWDITGSSGDIPPYDFPWEIEHWKPEPSAMENIVKGAALIAAGYDRIHREIMGTNNV